jgi:hypothetical protein
MIEKARIKELQEELSGLGSSLEGRNRDNPFRVPEGYFEQLPPAVQDRILSGRKASPVRAAPRRLAVVLSSFALLAVIAVSLLLLGRDSDKLHAGEDGIYFSLYADLDPYFWYDMVLETDITADELQFGQQTLMSDQDEELLIDYLLERTEAYGLDAGGNLYLPDGQ